MGGGLIYLVILRDHFAAVWRRVLGVKWYWLIFTKYLIHLIVFQEGGIEFVAYLFKIVENNISLVILCFLAYSIIWLFLGVLKYDYMKSK